MPTDTAAIKDETINQCLSFMFDDFFEDTYIIAEPCAGCAGCAACPSGKPESKDDPCCGPRQPRRPEAQDDLDTIKGVLRRLITEKRKSLAKIGEPPFTTKSDLKKEIQETVEALEALKGMAEREHEEREPEPEGRLFEDLFYSIVCGHAVRRTSWRKGKRAYWVPTSAVDKDRLTGPAARHAQPLMQGKDVFVTGRMDVVDPGVQEICVGWVPTEEDKTASDWVVCREAI